VPGRRCLEEVPGEQVSVTKAKAQSLAPLVFGDQIELVADMRARARMCGDGNGSAAAVEVVMRSRQPVAFECLFDLPSCGGLFFYGDPELHEVAAAHLVGEPEFVMIGRIELIKGIPLMSRRILRAGGVVTLDQHSWLRGRLRERFPNADITCPCIYGR
jgi:hypothetical protein